MAVVLSPPGSVQVQVAVRVPRPFTSVPVTTASSLKVPLSASVIAQAALGSEPIS